jgi:hypothetical protein
MLNKKQFGCLIFLVPSPKGGFTFITSQYFYCKYLGGYLPPFKTKPTIEILTKQPFERGVNCRQNITQTETIIVYIHRLAKHSVLDIEKKWNIVIF